MKLPELRANNEMRNGQNGPSTFFHIQQSMTASIFAANRTIRERLIPIVRSEGT
jgi:hypothetical protein